MRLKTLSLMILRSLHSDSQTGQTPRDGATASPGGGRNTPPAGVVAARMSPMRHHVTLAILLLLAPACDAEPEPELGLELRAAAWDEVFCATAAGERCYAHSPSAKELWSEVVSWCDLQAMVDGGELKPTASGWLWACDYGGEPQTFADVECFESSPNHVVCFGGSGGWYTRVEPSCLASPFTDPAWPAVACDPDNSPGAHSYDSVSVVPAGTPWIGRVVDGGDAFFVVPECHVSAGGFWSDPYNC